MSNDKSLFFAFDGPNGSGKSSLLRGVAERLKGCDLSVAITREPTESELGRFIRKAEESYQGRSLAYLVAADRLWHVENEVAPGLADGKVVISDRYVASSLALQTLDGVDIDLIWKLSCCLRHKKLMASNISCGVTDSAASFRLDGNGCRHQPKEPKCPSPLSPAPKLSYGYSAPASEEN